MAGVYQLLGSAVRMQLLCACLKFCFALGAVALPRAEPAQHGLQALLEPCQQFQSHSLSPLSLYSMNVPKPRQTDTRIPLHRLYPILSQSVTGRDGIWCWMGHLVAGPPLMPEHPPCLSLKRHRLICSAGSTQGDMSTS